MEHFIFCVLYTFSLEVLSQMREKVLDKPFYFKAPFNYVKLTLSLPVFPFDPLKTWENQRFSDVFRGIEREHLEGKG